ncbi:hypothetical protein [Ruegeria atlantica]|uniref:hypothetical protein n=1 Tax=Ruegeria atlantica TaxID=81569 RepID=UPI002494CC91|nr:hypothetical protein [Ruegeria atlantica]
MMLAVFAALGWNIFWSWVVIAEAEAQIDILSLSILGGFVLSAVLPMMPSEAHYYGKEPVIRSAAASALLIFTLSPTGVFFEGITSFGGADVDFRVPVVFGVALSFFIGQEARAVIQPILDGVTRRPAFSPMARRLPGGDQSPKQYLKFERTRGSVATTEDRGNLGAEQKAGS